MCLHEEKLHCLIFIIIRINFESLREQPQYAKRDKRPLRTRLLFADMQGTWWKLSFSFSFPIRSLSNGIICLPFLSQCFGNGRIHYRVPIWCPIVYAWAIVRFGWSSWRPCTYTSMDTYPPFWPSFCWNGFLPICISSVTYVCVCVFVIFCRQLSRRPCPNSGALIRIIGTVSNHCLPKNRCG